MCLSTWAEYLESTEESLSKTFDKLSKTFLQAKKEKEKTPATIELKSFWLEGLIIKYVLFGSEE